LSKHRFEYIRLHPGLPFLQRSGGSANIPSIKKNYAENKNGLNRLLTGVSETNRLRRNGL